MNEDIPHNMTDRERVVMLMRLFQELREPRTAGYMDQPAIVLHPQAEHAIALIGDWVVQPTRAAARAWLEQHAAILLSHYAIALLFALSARAEEAALRAELSWRRDVALRARAVGISAAWNEFFGTDA